MFERSKGKSHSWKIN